MKLLRYGPPGEERPGLLDGNGQLRSLTGVIDDIAGEALLPSALARLRVLEPDTLPKVPSDIIATGTPPGVGMGQKPQPVFLRAGQRWRLGVEGLGEQRQLTVQD